MSLIKSTPVDYGLGIHGLRNWSSLRWLSDSETSRVTRKRVRDVLSAANTIWHEYVTQADDYGDNIEKKNRTNLLEFSSEISFV